MVTPDITRTPERARWLYTFKGVLYGSFAWPLLAIGMLLVASWYTSRPSWTPPQMEWPRRTDGK